MAAKVDLSGAPGLANLASEQVRRVEDLAIVREYQTDEVIFREGEEAYGLCFILSGAVKARMDAGGRVVDLDVLKPGELLGWSGLVPPHTFTTTAVCAQDCRLAILKVEDVQRLMTEDDKLGRLLLHNLSAIIADRLRRVQERLADLAR